MTTAGRSRKNRRDGRYWDDPHRNASSLGCFRCTDRPVCGGLHTASSAFDCTSYCCGTPHSCTVVCPLNPDFVDRAREVSGFDLETLERVRAVRFPALPSSVPLIYSRGKREMPFNPEVAAVSLYLLFSRRDGGGKFKSHAELATFFGLDTSTRIIASGTAKDPPIERWWEMGSRRREILTQLLDLGIIAATAPNFSVFSDVPRWDNLYAMKRIAICWREMLDVGLPAALHVNARTSRDWARWTAFVQSREEIDALAYEFATGAATRMTYHVDELRHLADRVNRPLKLLVRGALSEFSSLRQSFAEVTMLDSSTYMRTVNRKFGVVRESKPPLWRDAPNRPDVDLDSLIEHNHLTMLRATAPKSST
jgi:hypothetical protein